MNPATAERLLELNRRFYAERGRDFSETRRRVQPGVRRVLERLRGDENVLDLGCGNGAFAGELSRRGHRGSYLGVDSSLPLLAEARRVTHSFPVKFIQAELVPRAHAGPAIVASTPSALGPNPSLQLAGDPGIPTNSWSLITAFAVLHHIPGNTLRMTLLTQVWRWLTGDGLFIHSNWQFSSSSQLKTRIRPWSDAGLDLDLDDGDYLLDWRRGGRAFRYVHEFRQDELFELASASGFVVVDTFHADGADRKSGLYQVWRTA